MSKIDDRLAERLNRASRSVRTENVVTRVGARKRSVERRRRAGTGALAVGVLAATVGGFLLLSRAFGDDAQPVQPAGPTNGALVTVVTENRDQAGATQRLELVPLDGSSPRPLTADMEGWISSLSAAPDGRRVAYVSAIPGGERTTLTVLDLVTGEQRDLISGAVTGATWSPDGTKLAYWEYGSDEGIKIIPADGSGRPTAVPGTDVVGGGPAWSPDGAAIAFEERDVPGGPAVMTVDLATGVLRKLVATDGDTAAEPVWSPDGSTIAFALSGGIWQVDAAGGEPILLAGETREEWERDGFPPSPMLQSWSPDGLLLVYVMPDRSHDRVYIDALDNAEPTPVANGSDVTWLAAAGIAITPSIEPARDTAQAETIPGVPFPVCRASSLPGDFGPGLTRAWFFEAERAPGSGCANSEGFPRLAVGDGTSVSYMSAEIHDYMDGTRAWLYATPDLNADGMNEIALGVDGHFAPGFASIALYRFTGQGVQPVDMDCGPACDPAHWVNLGSIDGADHAGAFCTNEFGGSYGLVRWNVKEGTAELTGRLWVYDGTTLTATDVTVRRTGEASVSLPDGTSELCGSAAHWPST